jgi:hypothetical protein
MIRGALILEIIIKIISLFFLTSLTFSSRIPMIIILSPKPHSVICYLFIIDGLNQDTTGISYPIQKFNELKKMPPLNDTFNNLEYNFFIPQKLVVNPAQLNISFEVYL